MAENPPVINKGLEGVYFTESKICKVDGQAGKLYYRGYPIETLAKNSSFEEVCYLLLNGRLPTSSEFMEFKMKLGEERVLPGRIITLLSELSLDLEPMDVLRTVVSALAGYDDDAKDNSPAANMRKSIRLISRLGSIIGTIGRYRKGSEYIDPDPTLSHVENLMYMIYGNPPTKANSKLLESMFILHAEHSSNASTFSTLVTGSTLADIYAAITSGIATLKGPLHGGADEAALKMMRAIGTPENTEKYIDEALAGKQKIMGFGHRVYKTYDPRARIIKESLVELQSSSSEDVKNLTSIALSAEKMMVERLGESHGIWPNVDFFSGPVYTAVGVPPELFTPIFAASRIPGWCAHLLEYWNDNKLLRPLEYYNGELDLQYVPMGERM